MNADEARELSVANQGGAPIEEILCDVHRMVEEAASAGQWLVVDPLDRFTRYPTSRQWGNVVVALENEGFRYAVYHGTNVERARTELRWD